jgi:glycosyltransferase involved in cell wall biosynthesis
MNIIFIGNELGYRGTPRYLINCAALARQAGHKVLIWALDEGGAAEQTCAKLGLPVQIGFSEKLFADAAKFAPRIAHIHREGWVSARWNALLRRLKQTTECRILETNVFGRADLTRNDPIDLHAQISRWDLWRWRHWFWPIRRPSIYLPYCVDTTAFRPVPDSARTFRQRHGIGDDAFVVGRLGKTDWDEVRTAIQLAMKRNLRIVFASVDDYSGTEEDFSSWPQELQSRIVQVPCLQGAEALSAFYSACDLTVNFSPIGESFGYVVAEAMACGTPVVARSKPLLDNAQIEIADSICGAYPVKDARTAARVIMDCANTPPTPEQKQRCRDSIVKRYSLEVFAPRLEKVYQTLATNLQGRELEQEFVRVGFEADISDTETRPRLERVAGGGPTLSERFIMCLHFSLLGAIRSQIICALHA